MALLVAPLSACLLLAGATSAFAADQSNPSAAASTSTTSSSGAPDKAGFTPSDYAHFDSFLADYGVSAATRQALREKLKSGKLWDSWVKAQPVKSTTKTQGSNQITISTYADGSISVTGVENASASGGVSTEAIRDCVYRNGSGYSTATGCTVFARNGTIEMNFRADYQIVTGSANDSITRIYNDEVRVVGGTASGRALVMNRQKETSIQVAEARLSADITIGTAYTGTSSLYLQVGRNTAVTKATI